MTPKKRKTVFKSVLSWVSSFFTFFAIISFVVTCSFLIFFSAAPYSEEQIRSFAPIVFFNVFVLTILFVVVDMLRRKITVERPTREIQNVLSKLTEGDFSARISVPYLFNPDNGFKEISESINALASELSGVETLRTDLIANVSHELKTPLAVIQNYGTLLEQTNLSEENRIEYAKTVTNASRRLTSLITNILKLNKLENQQIFPSVSEYDLGEQICECLLQFENEWEKKELDIETDIEEGILLRSDPELLSIVWNNLISNAVKFTEPGGRISVSVKSGGEHVTVKVSDTGCGMTPEVGAHIFEKFYQGDSSHSGSGNGLGLALVKRVVDIVHGEIHVESKVGKGSTFTVTLQRS